MLWKALLGIMIPFTGTCLGASTVYFTNKELSSKTGTLLNGFAAGVMLAASVWSLIIPAMEYGSSDTFAFVPVCIGLIFGGSFLVLLESFARRFEQSAGSRLVLSVNIHNLPEGMAVGAAYSAWMSSQSEAAFYSAMLISIGVAIQNIPEGAIVSMPMRAAGNSKTRAFVSGVLSAVIEPLGAILSILFYSIVVSALPYLLSFAAGAMLYVVALELLPQLNTEKNNMGFISFALGFCLMMSLDVVFS